MNASTIEPAAAGWRTRWNQLADRLTLAVPEDLLLLATRIALAAIFWLSGRTKVDGWLTVSDNAVALFADEYQLPLLPPALGAPWRPMRSTCSRRCWYSAWRPGYRPSPCSG